MLNQLNIFIHGVENNPFSQAHRDENEQHFSKQCLKVYEILKKGEVLTVKSALLNYGISSLPRRIKDLKENNVEIKDRWVEADVKYKEWFI